MKRIALSILVVFALTLTACNSSLAGIITNATKTNNELPIETQIAVGTLKLAGTNQDVTAEQAKELVVLWQVYGEVSQSSTAAQEEVDGLVEQIQETMTTEQMQAITDMKLTQQDVSAVAQGSTVSKISSQSSGNTSNFAPPAGGDMAGGAPPDGGGLPADFGGGGSTVSTSQTSSTQASLSAESSAGVPITVVDAVIKSLEQKLA